jgi:lipopolysaccharide biosynthesis glycosyltransferase
MRGRWVKLHPRWNVQTTLYDLPTWLLPFPKEVTREAVQQPAVIHYNGPFKPWQYLSKHPMRGLYFEHLKGTPWPKQSLERAGLGYRLIRPLPISLQYKVLEFRPFWHIVRDTLRRWFGGLIPGSQPPAGR